MRRQMFVSMTAVLLLVMGSLSEASVSKEDAEKNPEQKALAQTAEALVSAFNSGDAKAVAALWSETGVLLYRETGERCKGREAIARAFTAQLARLKGCQMALTLAASRLITPDVATLEGTVKIRRTGEPT